MCSLFMPVPVRLCKGFVLFGVIVVPFDIFVDPFGALSVTSTNTS